MGRVVDLTDVYNRLFEIERLLEVVAGVESKEEYLRDKRARMIMREQERMFREQGCSEEENGKD